MKIALVFSGCHKRGGVERSIWEAARYWAVRHEVTVIAADIDETGLEGVALRPVPVEPGAGLRAFGAAASQCYRLEEFDQVISFGVQEVPATVLWVGSVHRAWLAASRTFPDTGLLRHPALRYLMPRHRELLALEKAYFARRGVKVVVVADAVGQDLHRLYGVPQDSLITVNNGFNPTEFDPTRRDREGAAARAEFGIPEDAVVATMVANELGRKGYDILLHALATLDPSLHLLLVGRVAPDGYAKLTERLGLTGRVHFGGMQHDVGRVHAASDLFVLPTKYEAFCMAIVEALASGLPVLTTSVPGAGDLITDRVNGRLVHNPNDSVELAAALASGLTPAREDWRQAARPSVDHLSWDKVFERAERLVLNG